MKLTMKPNIFVSFLLGLLFLCTSCSLLIDSGPDEKSENYSTDFSRSSWKKIDPDTSDVAYLHAQTSSIMLVNSMCKKYEASSFKQLTSSLLSGLEDIQYEDKQEVQLFGRKAIRLSANGSVDGVRSYFTIVSVKKNRCLYDFALITMSPKIRAQLNKDFESFINQTNIN